MTTERQATIAKLMAVEAAAFFAGAALHTGASVAIGPRDVREPRIVPAVIVESICGFALAIGAFGLAANRRWGRDGAIGANGIALAGTALGMAALAAGRGQQTELNERFHRVVFMTLLLGLGALALSPD
ncbi:MAG TPA: hypothetical protein VFQ80_06455 [Thermomicrobiales bacterium]|nr:hypothetical protein [Thermomicrobiales bacterium]